MGVNSIVMGLPALLSYYIFRVRNLLRKKGRVMTGVFGFLAGFGGIGVSVIIFVVILLTFIPADFDVATERAAIYTLALAYLPLMVIEGVFTALVTVFLQRVRPRVLDST